MYQDFEKIYHTRFSADERAEKIKLWDCLVKSYLQKFFGKDKVIIDFGCGFCEFINAVSGKKKYAYDIEPAFEKFAGPDVEFIKGETARPLPLADNSCDCAFASNFFEHLRSRDEVVFILGEAFRILKPSGRMVVIQPNIALLGGAYWDFFDHILPFTDKSLLEAMAIIGFRECYVKRRFLPYTTKTRGRARTSWLKLYLALPFLQWIFGKQSLIIVEKPDV